MNVPQIPRIWRKQREQQQAARDFLQDHEHHARGCRPFERRPDNVAVRGDHPREQQQHGTHDGHLPGRVRAEAARQPAAADHQRGEHRLETKHRRGGLQRALGPAGEPQHQHVPQQREERRHYQDPGPAVVGRQQAAHGEVHREEGANSQCQQQP